MGYKVKVKFNDPNVQARADYWWERNLSRMAAKGGHHWETLRALSIPIASQTRVADLVWPTT